MRACVLPLSGLRETLKLSQCSLYHAAVVKMAGLNDPLMARTIDFRRQRSGVGLV